MAGRPRVSVPASIGQAGAIGLCKWPARAATNAPFAMAVALNIGRIF